VKALHVLYDQECDICQRCRQWLLRQEAFVELRFIALQSPEVARRFPGLREWPDLDLSEKLVVISDEGMVYQGQNAWIMCLYALQDYREWAQRLAHPALRPLARRVCETVSRNRLLLSRFLKAPIEELRHQLTQLPSESCSRSRETVEVCPVTPRPYGRGYMEGS
jgi:predicted DCC family thiol-disulfide oxidoreductase YuxK